jgi:glycosyltransferase involved in cell wall biosynthesis
MVERPKTISKISLMRRVHVAHPGTQRGFRVARILAQHGRLGFFCTTIAFRSVSPLAKFFPIRSLEGIPSSKVRQWEQWREWVSVIGARFPGYGLWKDRWWLARNRAFGRHVGRQVGTRGDLLYGFDTSSYEMFMQGKRRGLKCILDQSIVHTVAAERVLEEIAKHRPQYAGSLEWHPYSADEIERRLQEVQLADLIVCPSAHVRDSVILSGCAPVKVKVVPFGIDLDYFSPGPGVAPKPFRVLFAGQVSQRKGVGYLLEAWKAAALPQAELIIAGSLPGGFNWRPHLSGNVRLVGRLSRSELRDLYQTCHCLAFPTLLEGQANVVLEAMACGCCVITTPASGVGDWLKNGENGILLQPQNIEAWAETLRCFAANPDEATQLGKAGVATAQQFSLKSYGERLMVVLNDLLK